LKDVINFPFFYKPQSAAEISKLAERTLKQAGALGNLPTPIHEVIKAATVTEAGSFEEVCEGFLSGLKRSARETFLFAKQKIRGIADLRDRVIYVPNSENQIRSLFPTTHELGHQIISWHNIDPAYLDDEFSLSVDVEEEFDREANFFASEMIFQGKRFRLQVLDYAASLHAVFKLATIHGASKQATIWRYVEEQDEAVAIIMYYPVSDMPDELGNQYLKCWKVVASEKFIRKYGDIQIPSRLHTGHPWAGALDLKTSETSPILDGKDRLSCGNIDSTFEWQSWWNRYTLFVLLRRVPSLSIIGRILR
jgi:hypothetical protein